MAKSRDHFENSEVTAEASAWVAQIESGELSEADRAALREWVSRGPLHAQELKAMAALSASFADLVELAEPLSESAAEARRARAQTAPSSWRTAIIAAAGALVVLIGVVAILQPSLFGFSVPGGEPAIYRAEVGEVKTVRLADGTVVELNADSQIEVDINAERRRVRLVYGEALFDVAHDPSRPFVVHSGDTAATAVGTSFLMRLRDQLTEIAVIEGVVEFARSQAPAAPAPETKRPAERPLILKASQVATSETLAASAAALTAPTVSMREIQRRLSWTQGFFDFAGTPLETVVAEIGRHNRVDIVIADEELRGLKVGGVFRTDDIGVILEALESLGVSVEQTGPHSYRLHKGAPR